jgi:predicted acylesterase/phospholipase RssA
VKGVGVLGALQYVNEVSDLKCIKQFYGSSVGGLLSVLLAINLTPAELFAYFMNFNFTINPSLEGQNLEIINYQSFMNTVEDMIFSKCGKIPTLKELFKTYGKKVFLTTYNYSKNTMEILSHLTRPQMKCSDAIKLSCALPFIFGRVNYEGNLYFDGGLVCNFPLNIAFKHRAQNILAINLKTLSDRSSNDTLISVFFNLLFTPIEHHVQEIVKKYSNRCAYIELKVGIPFTKFKLSAVEAFECFLQGYSTARAVLRGLE